MGSIIAAIVGGILYRLRGGWFSQLTGWKQKTQLMRLIWAVPTGALLFFLAGGPWWLLPSLIVSVFASMALYGHGAHMVFDTTYYLDKASVKGRTELLTSWWVPNVFGGIPDATWSHDRVALYNLVGMSFIGLVRNFTAILPLLYFTPAPAIIYGLFGLLHGPIYWAGWRINGKGETSEVLIGAATWAAIVLLFG